MDYVSRPSPSRRSHTPEDELAETLVVVVVNSAMTPSTTNESAIAGRATPGAEGDVYRPAGVDRTG